MLLRAEPSEEEHQGLGSIPMQGKIKFVVGDEQLPSVREAVNRTTKK